MLPIFLNFCFITMAQETITSDGLMIFQTIDEDGDYQLTSQNELLFKLKEEKCEKSDDSE